MFRHKKVNRSLSVSKNKYNYFYSFHLRPFSMNRIYKILDYFYPPTTPYLRSSIGNILWKILTNMIYVTWSDINVTYATMFGLGIYFLNNNF